MDLPPAPPLPSPFGPTQPRFYISERGLVCDRTGQIGGLMGFGHCSLRVVDALNKLDSEWWALASGEGVGTPDDETRNRVKRKVDLLLSRFYERGKRAGREEASQAATSRGRR